MNLPQLLSCHGRRNMQEDVRLWGCRRDQLLPCYDVDPIPDQTIRTIRRALLLRSLLIVFFDLCASLLSTNIQSLIDLGFDELIDASSLSCCACCDIVNQLKRRISRLEPCCKMNIVDLNPIQRALSDLKPRNGRDMGKVRVVANSRNLSTDTQHICSKHS